MKEKHSLHLELGVPNYLLLSLLAKAAETWIRSQPSHCSVLEEEKSKAHKLCGTGLLGTWKETGKGKRGFRF